MSVFDEMVSDTIRELKSKVQTSVTKLGGCHAERKTLECRAAEFLENFRRRLNACYAVYADVSVAKEEGIERQTLVDALHKALELV